MKSVTTHNPSDGFDLSVAYEVLIGAYLRSSGVFPDATRDDMMEDEQSSEQGSEL